MEVNHLVQQIMVSGLFAETKKILTDCEVLIIDEIGLISSKMFTEVEFLVRAVRENNHPFGGVHVIAAGSFVQLPPVPSHNDKGEYAFQAEHFNKVFPHRVHLNAVVRQKEVDLIAAINELCEGNPSTNTHRLMSSLMRPIATARDALHIFGTNYNVEFFNHMNLEELLGEEFMYTAQDIGNPKWFRRTGAPKHLLFKENCKVIVTRNLQNGLVNGLSGRIVQCTNDMVVLKVDTDKYLNHGFGGKMFEIGLYTFIARDSWNEIKAVRKQLPLKLGYAVTVHKAQGRSLDNVVIDSSTFWRPGQLGVAVGRATNKEGLQLNTYNKYAATLKHPQCVLDFYNERSLLMRQSLTCCNKNTLHEETRLHRPTVNVDNANNKNYVGNDADYMNTVNLICFPYDVNEYVKSKIAEMPSVTHIQRDQIQLLAEAGEMQSFHIFLNQSYSLIYDLFHKYKVFVKKSKCNWCQMCAHLHNIFASQGYKENVLKAFQTPVLKRNENSICTRLTFDILQMIAEDEASKVKKDRLKEFLEKNDEEPNFDCLDLSTLRYIAGASIHAVMSKVKELSMNNIMNDKYKARLNHRKNQLASKLVASKSQLDSECIEPQSLLKLIERDRGGLLYVTDSCFIFFKMLLVKIRKYQNLLNVQLEPAAAFLQAMKAVGDDTDLIDMWFNLFAESDTQQPSCECTEETTQDNELEFNNRKLIDLEMDQVLILDLYEQVTFYFCKVHFREKVEQIRDHVFQKHKTFQLRHRVDVDSQISSPVHYPCGECKAECIEIIQTSQAALEDFSVQCDKCTKWFHYICLNLTGNEPELREDSDLPFFCKYCLNVQCASADQQDVPIESSPANTGKKHQTAKSIDARTKTKGTGRAHHGRGRGRPKSSDTEQSAKAASTTYVNKSKNPEATNVSSRGRIRKSVVKLDI